jgi:hypothetical protein
MAAGFKEIITQLEQQRDAIERALSALRDVDESSGAGVPSATATSRGKAPGKKRKGGMSPEGKQRLIAALKARWAAKKAAAGDTGKAVAKKAPGKRGRPRKVA